jgi:hypothetical protein
MFPTIFPIKFLVVSSMYFQFVLQFVDLFKPILVGTWAVGPSILNIM